MENAVITKDNIYLSESQGYMKQNNYITYQQPVFTPINSNTCWPFYIVLIAIICVTAVFLFFVDAIRARNETDIERQPIIEQQQELLHQNEYDLSPGEQIN